MFLHLFRHSCLFWNFLFVILWWSVWRYRQATYRLQLLLPGLISLSVAASFQSGLDCLSFPGNKPIISWSQRFVFVTVWWCDRVPQGALFSPMATHQTAPTPPQSDVSELWISLDCFLWNMNFKRGKDLGKTKSQSLMTPVVPRMWLVTTYWSKNICKLPRGSHWGNFFSPSSEGVYISPKVFSENPNLEQRVRNNRKEERGWDKPPSPSLVSTTRCCCREEEGLYR